MGLEHFCSIFWKQENTPRRQPPVSQETALRRRVLTLDSMQDRVFIAVCKTEWGLYHGSSN